MKRTARYRVRKRDGRTEWLRGSKLLRSIGRALAAGRGLAWDGCDAEDWRSADLAAAVLTGLQNATGRDAPLTTARLAGAVQQVLVATGFPRAAEAYVRASGEQRRRRLVLEAAMPSLQHLANHVVSKGPDSEKGHSQKAEASGNRRADADGDAADRSVNRRRV